MKILSKGSFFSLFTFLLIAVALVISSTARAKHEPCPAGTVPIQGHKCLMALAGDTTLSSTIVVESRMILDCQGYTLRPLVPGTVDDATTTDVNEFTPSQPDLAIFLNNTVDAKVQNCVIGIGREDPEGREVAKFDFGVYALNSDHNAIKHNTINVHVVGVQFLNSSYNKLSENEITYGSEVGRGVHLNGDSDSNIIEGNLVTSTGDDETIDVVTGRVKTAGTVRFEPGTYSSSAPADVAIHSTALNYDLLNLKVNDEVIQVPREVEFDNPDGNIVDSNETRQEKLTDLSTRQLGIMVAFGTRGYIITHNKASGGRYGIFSAGEPAVTLGTTFAKFLPGTCDVSGEYCIAGTEVDCPSGAGTCSGKIAIDVDGRNFNNLIEKNELSGPYHLNTVSGQNAGGPGGSAIQVQQFSVNTTVRGNTITGDLAEGTIPVGIGLTGKGPLETGTVEGNTVPGATVEHNRVSGATVGLRLIQRQNTNLPPASFFGALITLNDFSGNGTNVKSTGIQPPQPAQDYTLVTELSVDDQGNVCGPASSNCRGNYWGHTCAESNGFIEFGNPGADSDDADVIDSNAYENLVAGTAEEDLPMTCF